MTTLSRVNELKKKIEKKKNECDIVWNSHKHGIVRLYEELHLLKVELSAYKSFAQDMAEYLEEKRNLIIIKLREESQDNFARGFDEACKWIVNTMFDNKIKELREIAGKEERT